MIHQSRSFHVPSKRPFARRRTRCGRVHRPIDADRASPCWWRFNFLAGLYCCFHGLSPRVFKKEDSLVFSKKNIERSQLFYEKHGGKTIIFARFIPVVRTFAPVIAGVGKMPYRSFIFFNLIGALIWAVGVTLLGYFLGSVIPDIDKYLLPIAVFIIAISIAPAVWHLLKDQQQRADYLAHAKKAISKIKTRKNK